jgi:uncharacterized paraquat-inducible protein A
VFFGLFSTVEVSVISGVLDLWETDIFLAVVVGLFAVIMPYAKTLLLAAIQFGFLGGASWLRVVEITGKLSMVDVFLVALFIMLVKGIGIGHAEPKWGFYLFTTLVLSSIIIAYLSRRYAASSMVGANG